MAITVIGAKKEGNYLYVTIQAPSQEEAVSPEARRAAYEERDRHGFSSAGIEAFGGTMPVNLTEKDEEGALGKPLTSADLKTMTQDDHRQRIGYRAVYRLMRGI
jgi:hypothetical protein